MICPKCNGENPDGSVFCSSCGEKMEVPAPVATPAPEAPVQEAPVSAPVEPVVEAPVEPVQPVQPEPVIEQPVQQPVQPQAQPVQPKVETANNNYSVSPKPKTAKNRLSIITIVAVFVALVVIGGIVLMSIISHPSAKKVYSKLVKDGVYNTIASPAVYADQVISEASVTFNTDIKELRDVDGITANVVLQADVVGEKAGFDLALSQDGKSYLDLKTFVDLLEAKKVSLSENNIYDKALTLEVPDEFVDEIKDLIPLGESQKGKKANAEKAAKIIYNTVMDNIPEQAFTKEKATVNINGKDKKVTNYMFKVDQEDLSHILVAVCKSLKDNNEFLSCYEENKGQIKEALNTMIDSAEELDNEDFELDINYYTSGMSNSFVGASVVVIDTYWDDQYVYEVEKTGKKTYEFNYTELDDRGYEYDTFGPVVFTVNKLKNNEVDMTVEYEFEDEGSIGLAIKSSVKYNKGISSNVAGKEVNVEDLTEDDMEEILDNFQNSDAYDMLNSFVENFLGEDLEDLLGGYDYGFDDDDDDDDYSTRDYVVSYDNDEVHYVIPSTFKYIYGSNAYMYYEKEKGDKEAGIEAWILYYDGIDDFYDSEKLDPDWYSAEDGYSNVKTTPIETVTVNGKNFSKFTNSYTYTSGSYSYDTSTTYYAIEVGKKYVYYIEVTGDQDIITEQELNDFLTITIK